MAPPKKIEDTRKTREDRHAAWQTMNRDSRGRWVKKIKSTGAAKSTTDLVANSTLPNVNEKNAISTEAEAQKILNTVQTEFNLLCPRCAGDMVKKNIRCGPERLVAVNKCTTCNFFIPINPAS